MNQAAIFIGMMSIMTSFFMTATQEIAVGFALWGTAIIVVGYIFDNFSKESKQ